MPDGKAKPRVAPAEGIRQVASQVKEGARQQIQKRLLTRQPGRRGGIR